MLSPIIDISIIIPIYKVEPYIVHCIDSVLHQTYRHLEVILVDDCSPDRSMQLAREHIEQSPLNKDLRFIYLKHDHNCGISATRNTGMDAATGEYVYFLDSDDGIPEDAIGNLWRYVDGYQIIQGDYVSSDGNHKISEKSNLSLKSNEEILKALYSLNTLFMNKVYQHLQSIYNSL